MARAAPSAEDSLQAGLEALARGAFLDARAAFESALADGESAEALEGLSWAAWRLNDADAVFEARERAYRHYRAADDWRGAVRMALWLATDHQDFRGEQSIANGWYQRAHRLLEGRESAPEHGWLAVHEGEVALQMDDVASAKRLGGEAADLGRRLQDVDLEMMGLATEGLALVTEGRIEDGMRRLDEASAAALGGELRDDIRAGWICCYSIYACDRVRDYDRAAEWCGKVADFSERTGTTLLNRICRTYYAGVLVWRGIWPEAEAELAEATETLSRIRPPYAAEGLVRLGELRRRQGRLDDAAEVLLQADWHPLALLGSAEVRLDRGDPVGACELVERLLREVPPDSRTQRAAGLELQVRACSAIGREQQAEAALAELKTIAREVPTRPLRASSRFAEGVLAGAGDDHVAARPAFEDAVGLFQRSGARWDEARARLELARALFALERPSDGEREARRALTIADELGAAGLVAAAEALLEGRGQASKAPADGSGLTPREREVIRLVAEGLSNEDIAGRLVISPHTVHRHVANIFRKLGVSSRAAAVGSAGRRGLL